MKKLTLFPLIVLFIAAITGAVTLNSIGPKNINENQLLTFTVQAANNISQVIYSSNSPVGTLNPLTGVFTWTPNYNEASLASPIKVYTVKFTVNDTGDISSSGSASETITIAVNNINREPVAVASADKTSTEINQTITLDASGSSDPDGDSLTYLWTQISGPATVTLSSTSAQKPTFRPIVIGTYVFNVTVSDSILASIAQLTIKADDIVRLVLSDLDAKVGSKKDSDIQNEANGYTIDRDVSPGDKIEITAKVGNTFEQDIDIEEVYMKVTIEGIDDGDDLEEETDGDTIKDGDDEKFTVEFEVPERVDEGSYDLIIEIEGEDENGKTHSIKKEFKIKVDKESHDIRITNADLESPTLGCNRKTNLNIDILNMGSEDEEEIRITATNSDIGLDFVEWDDGDIELGTGTDDDAEYSVIVPVDAIDAKPGDYPIEVRVYRDETKLEETKTAVLRVEKCEQQTTKPMEEEEKELGEEEEPVEVIVTPTEETAHTTPLTSAEQYPVVAEVEEESFFESNSYILLLAGGAIVLILLIILIIALLMKK